MACLDVRRGRRTGKLFLDVQADSLSYLKTRLVGPLSRPADLPQRIGVLHPFMAVEGEAMVLVTHLGVAVSASELGDVVTTLADDDYRIARALDVLIGTA